MYVALSSVSGAWPIHWRPIQIKKTDLLKQQVLQFKLQYLLLLSCACQSSDSNYIMRPLKTALILDSIGTTPFIGLHDLSHDHG